MKRKQEIQIKYNGEQLLIEPNSFEAENDKLYMIAYDLKKSSLIKILTDNIEEISITPNRLKNLHCMTAVVFEVYGRLTDNYRLREWERIQTFDNNRLIIVNYGEDKNQLIRRLLKYGENCKVLKPEYFKKEFVDELITIKQRLAKNENSCTNSY